MLHVWYNFLIFNITSKAWQNLCETGICAESNLSVRVQNLISCNSREAGCRWAMVYAKATKLKTFAFGFGCQCVAADWAAKLLLSLTLSWRSLCDCVFFFACSSIQLRCSNKVNINVFWFFFCLISKLVRQGILKAAIVEMKKALECFWPQTGCLQSKGGCCAAPV